MSVVDRLRVGRLVEASSELIVIAGHGARSMARYNKCSQTQGKTAAPGRSGSSHNVGDS